MTLLWSRGALVLIRGCDLILGVRGKYGSRMSREEVVSIIKVVESDQGGGREAGERWSDSEQILMVGPLGSPVVWTEKEKEKVWGLSS